MRWFGESWGAPGCELIEHMDTPLGAQCAVCPKLIDENDQGYELPYAGVGILAEGVLYYHRPCLAKVLGLEEK